MIDLSAFRRPSELSTAELIPYALLADDGVVMNKDGSMMAGWEFRGLDDASTPAHDRNVANARISRALASLGSGWCVHTIAVRRPCEVYPPEAANHFPDSISQLIDLERREFFRKGGNSYETVTSLVLTRLPDVRANRIESMIFATAGEGKDLAGDIALKEFRRCIRDFEDALSIALHLRRLKAREATIGGETVEVDDLLSFLDECITGAHRQVRLPACGMFLDSYIGSLPVVTGFTPRVGENHVAAIHIDGFPSATHAGILNPLSEMGMSFRWTSRFIPLDPGAAGAEIRKYTRKWAQKVTGILAVLTGKEKIRVDQRALEMRHDAEDAEGMAEAGETAFGFFTGTVMVAADTEEKVLTMARTVRKALLQLGFGARIEDLNAMEAWLGSMPGNSWADIRRPLVHSLNYADLCPTSTVWSGLAHCPSDKFPEGSPPLAILNTVGSTPFRLNLHVSDVGHTLVFGPTGTGKSTFLAFLAAQMLRYPNVRIFAFDKGLSLYAINQAVGGCHYEVGRTSGLAFAPLARIGSEDDHQWCCQWIETLIRLGGLHPTTTQREAIRGAMRRHRESEHKRLSDFRVAVQDSEIKSVLAAYVEMPIYEASRDLLEGAAFTCFEIEQLMNLPEQFSLPVLLYLFRRIETALKGQPTFVIIDEAWIVLGHPVFRDKLTEWLRVLRKANTAVVLATQSVTDAERSGILDILHEACPTKIFLPNPAAVLPEFADRYRKLGLNPPQMHAIANARPKREYFVNQPLGDRLVDLSLGPIALAFCARNSKEDHRHIRKIQAENPDGWAADWINRCLGVQSIVETGKKAAAVGLAFLMACPLHPGAQGLFHPDAGDAPGRDDARIEILGDVTYDGETGEITNFTPFRLSVTNGTALPWPDLGNEYWELAPGDVIPRHLLWDEEALCAAAGAPWVINGWGWHHYDIAHGMDPRVLMDAFPIATTPIGNRKYNDAWRRVTRHDMTLTGKLWSLFGHIAPDHAFAQQGLRKVGSQVMPTVANGVTGIGGRRITTTDTSPFADFDMPPAERARLAAHWNQGWVVRTNWVGADLARFSTHAYVRDSRREPVAMILAIMEIQKVSPTFHNWRYDQQAELTKAVANLPMIPNPDTEAVAAGREKAYIEITVRDYWEAVLRLSERVRELHDSGELAKVAYSGPGGSQIRTSDFLTFLMAGNTRDRIAAGMDPSLVAAQSTNLVDEGDFIRWFRIHAVQAEESEARAIEEAEREKDRIEALAESLAGGSDKVPVSTLVIQAVMSILMADYLGALFAFFGGRMTETTQASNEGHLIATEVVDRGLDRQGRRMLRTEEETRIWQHLAALPLPSGAFGSIPVGSKPVRPFDLSASVVRMQRIPSIPDLESLPLDSQRYLSRLEDSISSRMVALTDQVAFLKDVQAAIGTDAARIASWRSRHAALTAPRNILSNLVPGFGGAIPPPTAAPRTQATQIAADLRVETARQFLALRQFRAVLDQAANEPVAWRAAEQAEATILRQQYFDRARAEAERMKADPDPEF